MSFIWHNGTFKEENTPVFTANDRLRLGDGVFDTMLAIDNTLIHSNLHFSRLLHSANLLEVNHAALPLASELKDVAAALLTKNNFTQGRFALNTIITGGPSERGLQPPENPETQIVMRAAPVPDQFPPVQAIISETVRRNEGSPLSRIKSSNYGDNILALKEATEKNANEAIMLNNQGSVTCASSGNIFVVLNNILVTPPLSDGVLNGIARNILIKKYDAIEKSLTTDDLQTAQGLYITNSIRGATPVISLDGETLPEPAITIDQEFHIHE